MKKEHKTNSHFNLANGSLLKSKFSQVTIFIIIALIIITSIALVFVLFRKSDVTVSPSTNPQEYIEKCIKDYTKEAIKILSEQGGDIKPEGSVMYQGKNITYLCYTANFYKPCVNQRPMLIEHIKKEITKYIEPKIENCFLSLRQELEKKNYIVNYKSMNTKIELQTKKVIVTIERELTTEKNQETRKFKKFKTVVNSPIYDLAKIAMEIVNQEIEYCNFGTLGFMITYPQYDIRKFSIEEGSIYTIREIVSGNKFTFAIRSCKMPPGL